MSRSAPNCGWCSVSRRWTTNGTSPNISGKPSRSEERAMLDTPRRGMDPDIYDAFIEQLDRFVRERLIPAEERVEELNRVPDDILAEMRDMGLFGVTMPE